jgi:hypothetical protein
MPYTNASTWAQVVTLIPEIWERALRYVQYSFVMPGRVSVFADRMGMTPRNISEYIDSGGVQDLTETTDLTATVFDRELLATLTPAEFGKQIFFTDQRLETDDVANVVADAIQDLGYALGRHMEVKLLRDFYGLTGGITGSVDDPFNISHIFGGRAALEAAAIRGPYVTVMHPYQWLNVWERFTSLEQPAPLDVRNRAIQEYYLPGLADTSFVVSGLVPENRVYDVVIQADGGTFTITVDEETTGAIAWDATPATIVTALEALDEAWEGHFFVSEFTPDPIDATSRRGIRIRLGQPFAFTPSVGEEAVDFVVTDTNLTHSGDPEPDSEVTAIPYANSAIYNRAALALDMRRGLRIEPDRDASARKSELNATQVYAHGTWRAAWGVQIPSALISPI